MPSTLLGMVAGTVSMTSRTADKLIASGSGDAALLFLYLLRSGGQYDPLQVCKALCWDGTRLNAAFSELERLELVKGASIEPAPAAAVKDAPNYTSADIAKELENPQSEFSSLLRLVESKLGKALSYRDTGLLMELYDHLALPAEVIYLLVNYMLEDTERRLGKGRKPRMAEIRRQGYLLHTKGIDSLESATQYIEKLHYFRTQEGEVLSAIGIRDRQANGQERRYINTWLEMGFPMDTIALAIEKTTATIGTWKWSYCSGILSSWHRKGLHTLEEIAAAEEKRPLSSGQTAKPQSAGQTASSARPRGGKAGGKTASAEATQAAQQKSVQWMQEFLKHQQNQ